MGFETTGASGAHERIFTESGAELVGVEIEDIDENEVLIDLTFDKPAEDGDVDQLLLSDSPSSFFAETMRKKGWMAHDDDQTLLYELDNWRSYSKDKLEWSLHFRKPPDAPKSAYN